MGNAPKEAWEVLWRSVLILFAVFALIFLSTVVRLIYPWREQNVPLHVGMTVADLGQARPGYYISNVPPRRLRPLRHVPGTQLASFTGEIRVAAPSRKTIDLHFIGGYRTRAFDNDAIDSWVEATFPSEQRLDVMLRRLRPNVTAHLIVPAGGEFVLPKDVKKLPTYTGRLWGHEYAGMSHYRWRVEFVRGRAVEIREWAEGD